MVLGKVVIMGAALMLRLLMVKKLFGVTEVEAESTEVIATEEQDLLFMVDCFQRLIQEILPLMILVEEQVVEVKTLVMVHMLDIVVLGLEEAAAALDTMTLLIVELQVVEGLLSLMV
jgi:hypothetical protein